MPNNPNAEENLTAKRFEKGQSGNPGGKTSEQRKLEVENAERATRLRSAMLKGLEAELEAAAEDGDAEAVKMIRADILKLIKDSEDRGLGSPKATTELGGVGGGPIAVAEVHYQIFDPKEE